MARTESRDLATGATPPMHTAAMRARVGNASLRARVSISTGGLLAVALLAGEVAAFSAHLVSRASAVRSIAVDTLLDDFSAVSVAGDLGVSRQKVYEIARSGSRLRTPRARGGS